MERLLEIMARLRNPEGGCPWDLEQTFDSVAPYTIEEAYEVDDAIRRGAWDELRDELGDLLLQVVFHARMAEEARHFAFADVVEAVCDKLVRRHPHVFGDARIEDADAQSDAWEAQKRAEREHRGETSAMDGVPQAFPALLRARKLVSRAARAGFAWPDAAAARGKVQEELAEVDAELTGGNAEALREELGDLLFAVVALAERAKVEPEEALRDANAKFEGRFRTLESDVAGEGSTIASLDRDALMARWEAVKQRHG
ncbi:MAG: nucleoside triphosphate pyrophosphohydrolase [Myxococcota bacterium]